MTWTVVWLPRAEERLAELWEDAENRQAISTAVNTLESRLRVTPLEEGESREDQFRITYLAPVGIAFKVVEEDRLVTVVQIWSA